MFEIIAHGSDAVSDHEYFSGLPGVSALSFDVTVLFTDCARRVRLTVPTEIPPGDQNIWIIGRLCLNRVIMFLHRGDRLGYGAITARLVHATAIVTLTWENPAIATGESLSATHDHLGIFRQRVLARRAQGEDVSGDLADLEAVVRLVTSAPNWGA